MEQNEQNNGENSNPIVLIIFLGSIALAVVGLVVKSLF